MNENLKVVLLVALTSVVALSVSGCNPPSAASSKELPGRSPAASNASTASEPPASTGGGDQVGPPNARPADSSVAESKPADATEPAPATAPKVNRPPRADRLPAKPGDAEKITFDDLNLQMLPNIVFRPFMVNDRVKELEGQRVSISGYMHGGAAGSSGIKKFVLLKNTECKFGKDGQADHLAMVYLKPGSAADYTRSDIKVEGTLKIEPFTGEDGNTWSIYNLEDAQIR